MPEYDDVALEQILRRTLADRLGPMSLDLTVERVEARARVAARKRADRRRLVVLGLAAALILPVGWLLAGAPRPDFPSADTYQILVARWQASPGDTGAVDALDVVAIRPDGQERLVRRLRQEEMPQGYRLGYLAMVGPNGWLAVSDMDGTHWALLDLGDETREIQRIEANNSNQPVGWGPDGRFAWIDTRGMNVIDPRTGVTETDTSGWSTEQSDVFWTQDASGFAVISGTRMRSYLGDPGRLSWQNRPLGSSPGQSLVPAYEPLGSRRYSLAGDRFVVCSGPVHGLGMCPGDGRGLVVRQDLAGAVTEWDVTAAAGAPMSAGFASSDRGMWLVSQDYPGEADWTASSSLEGRVIVERLDDQGHVLQTLGAALGTGFSDPSLGGMAPDDSMARIDLMAEDPDTLSWILLPTDGSPATYHVGEPTGFVPTSAADRLPGAAFQPTAGVDAPLVGRAKDLVSAETLERYAETSISVTRDDSVVLRAASTDTGSGSRTLTFSVAPGHRIGVQITCSGRGTIDVTVADQGFGAECMADDQHAYGYTVDGVDGTDIPIQVNAERGAAWRIVIFDIRIPGTP